MGGRWNSAVDTMSRLIQCVGWLRRVVKLHGATIVAAAVLVYLATTGNITGRTARCIGGVSIDEIEWQNGWPWVFCERKISSVSFQYIRRTVEWTAHCWLAAADLVLLVGGLLIAAVVNRVAFRPFAMGRWHIAHAFALIAVLAAPLGYAAHLAARAGHLQQVEAALQRQGVRAELYCELPLWYQRLTRYDYRARNTTPLCFATVTGIVLNDAGADTRLIQELAGDLSDLDSVKFADERFDDDSVAWVFDLPQAYAIVHLDVSTSRITDATFGRLSQLPALEVLWATGTAVSDRGVEHLCSCPHLNFVDLCDTSLSDECVDFLVRLPANCRVNVDSTRITPTGLDRLREKEESDAARNSTSWE